MIVRDTILEFFIEAGFTPHYNNTPLVDAEHRLVFIKKLDNCATFITFKDDAIDDESAMAAHFVEWWGKSSVDDGFEFMMKTGKDGAGKMLSTSFKTMKLVLKDFDNFNTENSILSFLKLSLKHQSPGLLT